VNRFAEGVSEVEGQPATQSLDPLHLQSLVITPRAIADDGVRAIAWIRASLVGARHAEADLVVCNWNRIRTSRGRIDSWNEACARAPDVGSNFINLYATQIGRACRRSVVRMVGDDNSSDQRRHWQVVLHVAQQTYAAIARIGHAQRRVERNF